MHRDRGLKGASAIFRISYPEYSLNAGTKRASDLVHQRDKRMVMAGNDQVSGQVRGGIGMPVDIPDAVDQCPVDREELVRIEEPLETRIMVPREYPEGDLLPERRDHGRKFAELLPGGQWDAMLHVAEKYEEIRVGLVDAAEESLLAFFAPAGEMEPVCGHIRLDSEVKVCGNEYPAGTFDHQRRAGCNKFQSHNSLITPLEG
jgi:hypothetical protein